MAALGPLGLGPTELIIILVIILILFGPKRLPQLGKSLGKTMKAIREGANTDEDFDDEDVEDAPEPKTKKKKESSESSDDEASDEE